MPPLRCPRRGTALLRVAVCVSMGYEAAPSPARREHMPTHAEKAMEIWKGLMGKPEGTGEWLKVEQGRINTFADATLDHQFIHIDPEKSAQLSPYKVTIAHGFLTLSLVPHLGATVPMA